MAKEVLGMQADILFGWIRLKSGHTKWESDEVGQRPTGIVWNMELSQAEYEEPSSGQSAISSSNGLGEVVVCDTVDCAEDHAG